MPAFTVVTPSYNAASTLGEAIASLQAQTFTDWEHIVADDGSTDDTVALVQSIARRDSRVRLLTLPQNQGPSAARNLAMKQARGEFLAFLDADDLALPARFELQYQALRSDPSLDALGSAVDVFGATEGLIRPATDPTEVAIRNMFGAEFIMSAVSMRRSAQVDLDIWFAPGRDTAEDWEFFARFMQRARMGNHPEILARYRRSASQATAELVDRPDDRAASLRREQILWIGVPDHQIDIEAHIAVSPSYWPVRKAIPAAAFQPARVRAWMDSLSEANQRTRRYPDASFRQVVGAILDQSGLG